jgi:hypothetical protein
MESSTRWIAAATESRLSAGSRAFLSSARDEIRAGADDERFCG